MTVTEKIERCTQMFAELADKKDRLSVMMENEDQYTMDEIDTLCDDIASYIPDAIAVCLDVARSLERAGLYTQANEFRKQHKLLTQLNA